MSVVPLALYGASSLLINSTIWIFGGNSVPLSNGSYTLDVSQPWPTSSPLFDSILSKGATLLPLDLPSVYSRYFSSIVLGADKSSFWIHGGVSDAVDLTDAKQFAVYSIPDNLWSAAKGTNPPAVFAHSAVSDSKGVAYYYGGSSDVTNTDFSSVSNGPGLVKMDTRSSNYSVINETSGNPGVLAWHTATLVNDTLMYVIGGLQPAPSADFPVTVYNTVTNSWGTPIKPAVHPSKRYGHTAVLSADNSQIIVFGGTPDSTTFLNDVWTLNLATNQWTQRNTTGTAPSGRAYHNSVMFKTEMIVMFGSSPNATNTVYILDTNTWKWITNFDPNPPQPTTAVSSGAISTSTSAPSPPPFKNIPISIAGIAGIVLAAIAVLSVVMISVVQPRNRIKPTI